MARFRSIRKAVERPRRGDPPGAAAVAQLTAGPLQQAVYTPGAPLSMLTVTARQTAESLFVRCSKAGFRNRKRIF